MDFQCQRLYSAFIKYFCVSVFAPLKYIVSKDKEFFNQCGDLCGRYNFIYLVVTL